MVSGVPREKKSKIKPMWQTKEELKVARSPLRKKAARLKEELPGAE